MTKAFTVIQAAIIERPRHIYHCFYLLVHSELFRYWCLVRSSRIGATWRTFIKEDMDSFPFPNAEQLTKAERLRIEQFTAKLTTESCVNGEHSTSSSLKLYGSTDSDAEVITDTVTFRSQYRTSRLPAEEPLQPEDLDAFCVRLRELLQPLFTLTHQEIEVKPIGLGSENADSWLPPWRFVSISLSGHSQRPISAVLARIMRTAAKTSVSRIIVRVPGGGLVLGTLNQWRLWALSRARLSAVEVAREHSDWFPIPVGAARGRKGNRDQRSWAIHSWFPSPPLAASSDRY